MVICPAVHKVVVVWPLAPSTILIMAAPKADFDAVPVIDFALAKTDRAEYFKQLKFACEDVGFGVSAYILLSPQDVVVLLQHNRFSRMFRASKIHIRRRFSNWQTSFSPSLRSGRMC
jgi:hypothetical protein